MSGMPGGHVSYEIQLQPCDGEGIACRTTGAAARMGIADGCLGLY